jgi:hypothetical protein
VILIKETVELAAPPTNVQRPPCVECAEHLPEIDQGHPIEMTALELRHERLGLAAVRGQVLLAPAAAPPEHPHDHADSSIVHEIDHGAAPFAVDALGPGAEVARIATAIAPRAEVAARAGDRAATGDRAAGGGGGPRRRPATATAPRPAIVPRPAIAPRPRPAIARRA